MYSFLMSIYAKEKSAFLIKSIESMLNQTIEPEEIVIVKDGKLTRELNKIIDEYESKYPDIFTIIQLKENVGLGVALNEGLKRCRNDLVARMDSDDISLPNRCELQMKEFKLNPELDIIGSSIDEFVDNPENIVSSRELPLSHSEILKFSKRRNPFNHPTVMYKKSSVLRFNGYNDYRRNQDFDLFVRMLHGGVCAKNIEESLVLFRADENNLARRKSWLKTSSNIKMLYDFYRLNHSSFLDFTIASLSHLLAFLMPGSLFNLVSKRFLRK